MNKKSFLSIIFGLCFAVLLVEPLFADFGPKQSVRIEIENVPDNQNYVITLFSLNAVSGPHNSNRPRRHNDTINFEERERYYEIFFPHAEQKNAKYLNHYQRSRGDSTYVWGYYPPMEFYIALYVPATERMFVTENTYSSYAFHSVFKMNMEHFDWEASHANLPEATKAYDYSKEAMGFGLRILATLVIELGLAWLLFYRRSYQVRLIILTNILTQILLNIVLALAIFKGGPWAFYFLILPLEVVVFLIEAIVYRKRLIRGTHDKEKVGPVLYAFIANSASFVASVVLYQLMA